jgi:predicted regulator of Ras-like GTPase activity (Roadblock/LC7/MglB family)
MLTTDLILQKIQTLDGVKGCLIVGVDGLVIDSILPLQPLDKDLISALVSSIYTETAKQSARINRQQPNIIIMETDDSVLTIIHITLDNEIFNVFTEFKKGLDTTQIYDDLRSVTDSFK